MITFPASPTTGQQYSEGGTTWEFNGTVWNVIAETTGEQTVDNISIGVTTDNTIDTTLGALTLDSADNKVIVDADLDVTGYAKVSSLSAGVVSADADGKLSSGSIDNLLPSGASSTFLIKNSSGNLQFAGILVQNSVGADGNTNTGMINWDPDNMVLQYSPPDLSLFSSSTHSHRLNQLLGVPAPIMSGQRLRSVGPPDSNGDWAFEWFMQTATSLSWSDANKRLTYVDENGGVGMFDLSSLTPTSILELNISDGTAGHYLSTDGAGAFSFSDPLASVTDINGPGMITINPSPTTDASTVGDVRIEGRLTVVNKVQFNGLTQIGNAVTDDLDIRSSFISNVIPKDTETYNVGSADNTWNEGHFKTIHITDKSNLAIPEVLTDLSISDGTAGQLLSANGDGTFTFVDPNADDITDTATKSVPTNILQTQWNEAYSWGDHADESYIRLNNLMLITTSVSGAPPQLPSLSYNNITGVFGFDPGILPDNLLHLGISDGTTGQLLSANGDGTFTFIDPPQGFDGDYNSLTNKPDLSPYLTEETVTTLTWTPGTTTLTFRDEQGTDNNVDLSVLLDEDSRSIASGVLNGPTGIVTFTRDDASTFTLDLSDLLDDTNLVTSVAGKNGVVTLDANDINDSSTKAIPTIASQNNWDTAFGWGDHSVAGYITTETNTSLTWDVNTTSLTYTDEAGTANSLNLANLLDTDLAAISSGTLNDATGVVTFTREDGSTFTLDLAVLNPNVVTSVAGRLGDIVLNADDISNSATSGIPTLSKQNDWDTAFGWGDHGLQGYLTSYTEVNDLSSNVTWANVPDANITESSVTQHRAAMFESDSAITIKANGASIYVEAGSNNVFFDSRIQANNRVSFHARVDLGSASGDDIHFYGRAASDLKPNNPLAHDLGGDTNRWRDLYVRNVDASGDATINGSINFLGSLMQNGSLVDLGTPDPRITRTEVGSDVIYTFN